MKKYFNSFEGLRVFAFINVFLLHIGSYRITSFSNNAAWAVSFFFMLSGFLNGNKLFNNNQIKLKDTADFSLKKIVKIYPLYLVTLLIMLPFSGIIINNGFNTDLFDFIKKLMYHITLTQSFASDVNISYAFNGVSWFLSDYVFLMIITIPLIVFFKKIIKNKKHVLLFLIITIIFSFIYIDFLTYLKVDRVMWIYVFPISRIFEYISGMLLGVLFNINNKETNNNLKSKILYTFVEIIVFTFLVVLLKYMPLFIPYEMSIGWIIPNLIILLVFSKEKGFVSYFLGNKFFVYLGGLTFDAYLIHQVVNMYFYVIPGMSSILSRTSKVKASLFILLITFLIAEFNQKNNIFDKISKKILNNN